MSSGYLPTIIAAAVLTYLTRISGLVLSGRSVPATVQRFLRFVPVAAFAALIAPGLDSTDGDRAPRLIAAAVSAAIAYRLGRLWLCIIVGVAVYWSTRLII